MGKAEDIGVLPSGRLLNSFRETAMSDRTIICRAFAFLAALFVSTSAHAIFRAYVASDGNDANPCTLPQPCRLLPAALTAVDAGGEIWMLDSANYNTATVTVGKSVSILAVPGAVGSVVATGGPAISITAAGLKVALRNLVIIPLSGGGGTHGVHMTGASALTIEHSLLANLPGDGVLVQGTGTVKIADTIIRDTGDIGVNLQNGAAGAISRTQMLRNSAGGVAATSAVGTTTASVSDSAFSGGGVGVVAFTTLAGAIAKVFVTRSTIEGMVNAGFGSQTSGGGSALVTISYSMVTNNAAGWVQVGTGSIVKTLGNNHIEDNGTNLGSLTSTGLQ